MTRRLLALSIVAGVFFACLPELSAIKGGAVDAGDVAVVTACGDGFIEADAGETCDPGDGVTTTTCSGCQVQCPVPIDPSSGHCYYVANAGTPVTYAEATAACSGGHIVTIGSDREAALVDALISASYWVGTRFDPSLDGFFAVVPTEPGLPPPTSNAGCAGCYARALEPSDAGLICIVSRDGRWTHSACDVTAATVCEREPVGKRTEYCAGPYCAKTAFTLGAKRYLLYLEGQAATADGARATCAQFKGGRLAVFASREEREQLVQELVRLNVALPFTAWIGASNKGGTWSWEDGTPTDDGGKPSPWGGGQPATNAGRAFIRIGPSFFDSQLAQADGNDATPRPFICERAL